MKCFLKKFVAFILLMATSWQLTYGYGVTGHRVIAEIAQRHLTKHSQKEIQKLIGDQKLAFWANWPDFIKSDTTNTWKSANKWHYVDLPGHLEKSSFVTQLKALNGENLYTQILAMKMQLKDKSLSREKREIALRFLIHLVGDLHQPLHVGRDEDQGGNKIRLSWFGKPTNLHTLWDESLVDFQQYSYTEYATVLDIAGKAEQASITQSMLEDWFFESHTLSDKVYELSANDSKLSYKYNYIFVKDLNNELLKGGLRLAALLNEVL